MLEPVDYFRRPLHPLQRCYETLRSFFLDGLPAVEVARRFGFTAHSFEALASQFRQGLLPPFFRHIPHGRKDRPVAEPHREVVLGLYREEQLSVIAIAERLRAAGRPINFPTVWLLHPEAWVNRLPKRATPDRPVLLPLPVSDVGEVPVVTGREVESEPARQRWNYLLGRGEKFWTWVGTGGLARSKAAEHGLRFHIEGKR